MSGDIRSYFGAAPKIKSQLSNNPSSSKRKNTTLLDDSVIPETPSPKKNKTEKKKKRKVAVISDSDDSDNSFVPSKISKTKNGIENNKSKNQPQMKEVKAVDFFGNAPAHRSLVPNKVTDKKQLLKTELGIHSDRKFEDTLIQLDNEKKITNVSKGNSPVKIELSNASVNQKIVKSPQNIIKNSTKKLNDVKVFNQVISSDKKNIDKPFNTVVTNQKCEKKSISSKESKISSVSPEASKPLPILKQNKNINEKSKIDKDFSYFINDSAVNASKGNESDSKRNIASPPSTPKAGVKSKKNKISDSEKTPDMTDEEKFEKKRYSAMLYQNYLNRSGPKHHGTKEVPEGSADCFKGLAFLITGVLDSFERDEISEIIKKYSGEVKSTLSGKVTHLVCGEDAGPAKIAKAEKLGTKIINEDEFLDLIRQKSSENVKCVSNKCKPIPTVNSKKTKDDQVIRKSKPKQLYKNNDDEILIENNNHDKKIPSKISDSNLEKNDVSNIEKLTDKIVFDKNAAWVDKYRPITVKQIIGQHGDASCASKLHKWLSNWYQNRRAKLPKPNPWSKGDGGYYRAILLSGSPGIGKTTTVSVISKELGFDTVEFNASDTRSKNLIQQQITEITCTNSLSGFFKGKTGKGAVSKKHLIIMDEVDGMAGNEDRGGMQELINLVKKTEVPIVCICNDKSSPKMRSLLNYCYDITFPKPKVEQIKAALLSICYKEGIKISPNSLTELIISASQDMRQILNLLSMWSSTDKNLSIDQVSQDSKTAKKDVKMGPWTTCRSIFSEEEHKNMTIHDKNDLFFNDYSLIPLFVHQNYLKVIPHCPKKEILKRFADASDCLSAGDLVDSKIRKGMAWNLLPTQAMFSSVIPGSVLSGHIQGQIDFPGWLGQNSRANKMNRLAQEIQSHTRLSASGSKESIRLDYAFHIRNAVLNPLMEGIEGIQNAVDTLQSYNLLRDDLDSLIELTKWPGQKDINAAIDSRIKSAMTKKYNKEVTPLPYSQINPKKSHSNTIKDSGYDDFIDSENLEDIEGSKEDSDVENDAMIKKSKVASSNKAKIEKKNPKKTINKGKGKKK